MQRFVFTFILIILCLGQPISHAQENTNPTNTPLTSTTAKQEERPTQHNNTKPNQEETQKYPSGISTVREIHDVSVDQSSYKLAEKANIFSLWQTVFSAIGLVLIAFATWFAWGAWRAGERGVSITRKAAQAEYQPYIVSLHDSFDISRYIPDISNTSINFVGDLDIKNVGRTPASNVNIAARIKYKNQGRRFDENAIVTNWKFDDLHPKECRTFKLNFELLFPDGDAKDFMKIREMDIFITITFRDIFTETRSYILHFLIDDMATGAQLQGAKEENNS